MSNDQSPPVAWSALMSPNGRASLQLLQQLVASCSRAIFVERLRQPVLAGSSIQPSSMVPQAKKADPNQTAVFQIESNDQSALLSEVLKNAVYPLVKQERSSARVQHIFTVGRVNENDLIIPDLSISKRHAIIETGPSGYSIRDYGSTNGTRLNGAILDGRPHPLKNEDIVAFGRYAFSFLSPGSLYDRLEGR